METIGSLVDKISIANLKIYHMEEQAQKPGASPEHRKNCRLKLEVLKTQRQDLEKELNDLFKDVASGRQKLKVYRQFKMYNDPIYGVASRKD